MSLMNIKEFIMRIKVLANGGYDTKGFTSPGGTVTGKVILFRDPLDGLEAATKNYVDNQLSNFSASAIGTGTLQSGRLPSFSGDLTSNSGSSNLSLVSTGVSAGFYSKVSVNSKGLVTNGTSLNESDIPDLSYSKITTNKPTTVDGYGISNALKTTGGTLTGNLTLFDDPVNAFHAVTKQYVDNAFNASLNLKTGDIIAKAYSDTPVNFLKCNGGEVNRTTYADLFAVIGTMFGTPSSGTVFRLPDLSIHELPGVYYYIKI